MTRPHSEPEIELQRRWGKRHQRAGYVTATDGTRLRILFAGWPNSGRGPDFQGAIFKAPGQPVERGDVELHCDSAGWFEHCHDRDQHYAGVVLHVVGATRPVSEEGRYPKRTAVLPTRAKGGHPDPRPCVEPKVAREPGEVRTVLRREGEARFSARVIAFSREIVHVGTDQALFSAILSALGYAKNQSPFQRLAEVSNYAWLRDLTSRSALGAALFGSAGLLPSQRGLRSQPDAYTEELEGLWTASGLAVRLDPSAWQFFRIRPENHPVRRVAASCALISRYRERGLGAALSVAEAVTSQQVVEHCRSYLALEADTYWAQHFDFGRAAPLGRLLIGPARAAAIIVNVLLPFLAATAQAGSAVGQLVREAYATLPGSEENQITARMREMLRIAPNLRLSACEEQGLIALYKRRCSGLFCAGCALG